MWFKFPEGTTAISVQQQNFRPEFKDESGRDLFRAPAHFASDILRNRGFEALGSAPEGAPEDLVAPDPLRDGVILDMGARVAGLEAELSNERTNTSALRAELGAALHERDLLKLKLHEVTQELETLKSEAEEKLEEVGPQTSSRRKL